MKSIPFSHERLTKRQRKLYHGKLTDNVVAQVVSHTEPLVLQGIYHRDQHWFSFMARALFLTPRREESSRIAVRPSRTLYRYRVYADRYKVRQLLAAPVAVDKESRKLVNYDNPDQLPLPFYETRKLTSTQFKFLHDHDYPGFDRDEKGRIFKFKVKMAGSKLKQERKDAREWCDEMCHGRYYVTTTYAYFALTHDALLAKLAFG
jgi:hypothetical protein